MLMFRVPQFFLDWKYVGSIQPRLGVAAKGQGTSDVCYVLGYLDSPVKVIQLIRLLSTFLGLCPTPAAESRRHMRMTLWATAMPSRP